MKVINLNLILVLLLFTACVEFKPIAVYDIEPEQDNSQQEKVFFDETLGLLWQELKDWCRSRCFIRIGKCQLF